MKNIFLFIGLGLLLYGCEATDPKNDSEIFSLKCIALNLLATGANVRVTNLTVDEVRKHISVNYLTEGTYSEKGNIIFAEHSHEGDPFVANRKKSHIVTLRLDKISGFLEIGKYDLSDGQKVGTPFNDPYESVEYQCEKLEPVV